MPGNRLMAASQLSKSLKARPSQADCLLPDSQALARIQHGRKETPNWR
jgi:hypothetical protein